MEKMHKVSGLTVLGLTFVFQLGFLFLPSNAAGSASYFGHYNYTGSDGMVSIELDDSDPDSVNYVSSGGPWSGATIEDGQSRVYVAGHASASNLNLGAGVQIVSTANNQYDSDLFIGVDASNRLTVMPGNSGLSIGDTTVLQLKVRLDGNLHTEAVAHPDKGYANVELNAGLTVYDQAITIDTGEGYITPSQATFGASCELESYDVYAPVWGYNYSSYKESSWQIESNISEGENFDYFDEKTGSEDSMRYSDSLGFDTDIVIIDIEAIVGHTLDFEAYVDIYAYAADDCLLTADFNNTMAFEVSSLDDVSLSWAVVPEPASLALFAAGSLLLRRKRQ
ncbi:MAG: PEP-CTERM sorting domain-containing protein [Sedimentisphaerales bacterium]|nr:PEP-CTERM sorting domain-containing protein [Sedimentisphaerales bacterium]MBN2842583.1 PEP-CTERM sorting domain-containing protein [Sedimentisphaerales bacterium]